MAFQAPIFCIEDVYGEAVPFQRLVWLGGDHGVGAVKISGGGSFGEEEKGRRREEKEVAAAGERGGERGG